MDKLSREFLIMLVLAFRLESRTLDSSSAVERSSHGYNYEFGGWQGGHLLLGQVGRPSVGQSLHADPENLVEKRYSGLS